MTASVSKRVEYYGGNYVFNGMGEGEMVGAPHQFAFPPVASVSAGAALTTIQARVLVPFRHRVKGFAGMASAATVVAAGTDPTFSCYRSLPKPTAPSVALISPAAAGNIEDGTHGYAICNINAAGTSIISDTAYVTVADKTTNGKVVVTFEAGPSGTTSRKIYRTEAGGTDLKLLATISDNTTLTYTDNIADGSLGAAAPAADASGVTILSATLKLSATDRAPIDEVLVGTLANGVEALEWDACIYTLRALTGAATGAITNLNAILRVERVPE